METNIEEIQKMIDVLDEITLDIDYTKTIEETILDVACNWGSDISVRSFSSPSEITEKKARVFTRLFHFEDTSSEDIITNMDKVGYRPATLMELIVYGAMLSDFQRKLLIIALGSSKLDVYSILRTPCLCLNQVCFVRFDNNWSAHCCFLGVLK